MPTPIEYQYDVFISYSHTDAEWVKEQLLPRLEQGGLKVNIDYRDFDIGAPSLVNMERAVDNSRHTLAVLTPAYVASDWTAFEGLLVGTIDPAARQRKLFPLLLKPCQPPRRIAALSYADFTKPQNYAAEFVRLLKQLQDTATVAEPSAEAVPPTTPPAHPERARPARGGDSISNDDGGGATLGCLVVDRAVPKHVYILSDFNAMCDLHGPSYVGDAILQPGRVDGGSRATDVIATLSRLDHGARRHRRRRSQCLSGHCPGAEPRRCVARDTRAWLS